MLERDAERLREASRPARDLALRRVRAAGRAARACARFPARARARAAAPPRLGRGLRTPRWRRRACRSFGRRRDGRAGRTSSGCAASARDGHARRGRFRRRRRLRPRRSARRAGCHRRAGARAARPPDPAPPRDSGGRRTNAEGEGRTACSSRSGGGLVGGRQRGVIINGPRADESRAHGQELGTRRWIAKTEPAPTGSQPEAEEHPVSESVSGFGVNAALVEEIRQRYEVDPSSVHASWAEFFEQAGVGGSGAAAARRGVRARRGPARRDGGAAGGQARARAAPDPLLSRARTPRSPTRIRSAGSRRTSPSSIRRTTASATTISTGPSSPAICRAARCRRCARSWSGCARPTAARSASSSRTSRIPGARPGCSAGSRSPRTSRRSTPDERLHVLQKLSAAELFERFLHTKFVGQKRFSLEGAESLIPLLDTIVEDAPAHGVREIVLGMAHRGRLNVLSNILRQVARVDLLRVRGQSADRQPLRLGRREVPQGLLERPRARAPGSASTSRSRRTRRTSRRSTRWSRAARAPSRRRAGDLRGESVDPRPDPRRRRLRGPGHRGRDAEPLEARRLLDRRHACT